MMLSIDKTSSKPYYEQLVLSVKESVIQGVLQPGDQLPSVREAAKQLLMNPNTVSKAYKVDFSVVESCKYLLVSPVFL